MRAVKPWITLLREAVECPSLQIFKTCLDMALSNLVLFRSSPALSRKLEQIMSSGPFQPKLSLILQKQTLQVCIVV